MRAAVLHAVGEPMRLEETRLAEPRAGEVLVRVQAAGVCHSDLHYLTGDLTCRLPVVLGHEGTGIVERTGPEVRGLEPGDAVVLMWRPRCGQCEFCLARRPALCSAIKVPVATGGLLDGSSRLSFVDGRPVHHFLGVSCFAEYCVVAQESVVKIPPDTPPRIAALAGCAVVTGVGAALNVMGAGAGAGVLRSSARAVSGCRRCSARCCASDHRGRCQRQPARPRQVPPINELVQKDIRVVGSLYGSSNTVLQIPRLLELYQAGRLPLDRLLGSEYRLEDINVAHARLPAEPVGRGPIVMGEL